MGSHSIHHRNITHRAGTFKNEFNPAVIPDFDRIREIFRCSSNLQGHLATIRQVTAKNPQQESHEHHVRNGFSATQISIIDKVVGMQLFVS
jgi:hypothetical protein